MIPLRITLAQVNVTVGDLAGNAKLILDRFNAARSDGTDLVVFPELAITGYPPEDLLLKPGFVKDNISTLRSLAACIKGAAAVVGFVDVKGAQRFNAAAWIVNGRVQGVYHKRCLPNYGVFDEQRYFSAGTSPFCATLKDFRVAVTICEDIWLGNGPLAPIRRLRPDVVINLSASPYHREKIKLRQKIAAAAATYMRAPLLYANLVGGQDELVFDGGSFAMAPENRLIAQAPQFQDALLPIQIEKRKGAVRAADFSWKPLPSVEEIYRALVLAVRDYVGKNGFSKVAIGLSGGIDSALVAAIATAALGPERVVGVTMPSRFNLSETKADAAHLAKNLGIRFLEIPIEGVFKSFLETLRPLFKDTSGGLAEENLQARIRGSLLMALSNKFGWLVLTTGNKSEMSTGYCTLYGDTAGGFAVLKDVIKTTVYDLSRFINQKFGSDLIPQSIIDRAPTAELRENQKDEDSLGPYAQLDPIIVDYIEGNAMVNKITAKNRASADYVSRIVSLIDRSEYKRRQAPPGVKITPRAFGRDHRMPITNGYRPYRLG
jgi:NAD+ synthase (glutamine-hydrolysing)